MLDLTIKLFGTLALLGEVLGELFLLALEILDLGGALDFFLLELTLLRFTEGEELLLLRMVRLRTQRPLLWSLARI